MSENQLVKGYVGLDWYTYVEGSYELHYNYIQEILENGSLEPYGNGENCYIFFVILTQQILFDNIVVILIFYVEVAVFKSNIHDNLN